MEIKQTTRDLSNAGGGDHKGKPEPKLVKKRGGKAKKAEKTKTQTWSEVVTGLKIEDELETTNSDKSKNESEAPDLEEVFDSKEPNQVKAKQTRRQRKSTSTPRSPRIKKH